MVYASGKTADQTAKILPGIHASGLLHASEQHFAAAKALLPDAVYHSAARCITVGEPPIQKLGKIAVVCAGTSDFPVAEEAQVTAEVMGNEVIAIHDVGVAGIHRVMQNRERLSEAAW